MSECGKTETLKNQISGMDHNSATATGTFGNSTANTSKSCQHRCSGFHKGNFFLNISWLLFYQKVKTN